MSSKQRRLARRRRGLSVCADPTCPEISNTTYCSKHHRLDPENRYQDPEYRRLSSRASVKYEGQPCPECGEPMIKGTKHRVSLDHHIPLSMGGTHAIDNLLVMCWLCNNRRKSH